MRHLNGVSLTGQWWPAYSGIAPIPKKKNSCQSWTPSDKTFWIHAWLITFVNSFYPDQAQHFVEPDLDPNCLALLIFLKGFWKSINRQQKKKTWKKFPSCRIKKAAVGLEVYKLTLSGNSPLNFFCTSHWLADVQADLSNHMPLMDLFHIKNKFQFLLCLI